MKRQNNSVSNWSIKGIASVTILSAMLCTFNANSKPSVGNTGTVKVVSENGVESLMYSNAGTKNEYNAKEFVQADMANEIENWMNSDTESNNPMVEEYDAKEFVQVDIADEIESWMNTNSKSNNGSIEEYNAKKFVQADMANEFESWLRNSNF